MFCFKSKKKKSEKLVRFLKNYNIALTQSYEQCLKIFEWMDGPLITLLKKWIHFNSFSFAKCTYIIIHFDIIYLNFKIRNQIIIMLLYSIINICNEK